MGAAELVISAQVLESVDCPHQLPQEVASNVNTAKAYA